VENPVVTSLALSTLREINAGAIGLIFTVVYKLWQVGFMVAGAGNQSGSPLGKAVRDTITPPSFSTFLWHSELP